MMTCALRASKTIDSCNALSLVSFGLQSNVCWIYHQVVQLSILKKGSQCVHFAANNGGYRQVKHHTLFVVSISETFRTILQQHLQLL